MQASGVEVASFWPKLFVGAMKGEDMNKLICSLPEGAGGGGGGGGGAAPAAAAPAAGGKNPSIQPPFSLSFFCIHTLPPAHCLAACMCQVACRRAESCHV